MTEAIESVAPTPTVSERRTLADTPLRKFFDAAMKFEASDLLLRGGQVPKLRVRGTLKNVDTPPLDEVEFEQWVEQSMTPERWEMYSSQGSLDLALDVSEGNRFRVNIFRTRGRSAISARRVSNQILDFEQLYLPKSMREVAEKNQGLILICGVTGSGKSTTLASMVQHINQTRPCHILTIEDPIEYLFQDDKAVISQREVGIDVPTFPIALRAMVRENPDVVLIGEMRDKETFESALQAAETGHLVFGTVHASSASQAFGRIYDLFPPEEREAVRNLLAYQMQAFVYQKLLPTIRDDVDRVPAVEILLQSPPTRRLIIEGREGELTDVIKHARDAGMQSFVDSLINLVEAELIHPRTAQAAAPSADEVKMRLRGISSG